MSKWMVYWFFTYTLLHWIHLSSFNNALNPCSAPFVFFNYFLNHLPSPIVLFQLCSKPLFIFGHLILLDFLIFLYLFQTSFNYDQTCWPLCFFILQLFPLFLLIPLYLTLFSTVGFAPKKNYQPLIE